MGVSTDGILCYGFPVGEEDDPPKWMRDEDGEMIEDWDFPEFVATLYDLHPPDPNFDKAKYDKSQAYKSKWLKFWKDRDALMEKINIELVYHCSLAYPQFILAVKDSVKKASRGYPVELGQCIDTVRGNPSWRDQLEEFCEKTGIEFQEPQFYLCSLWG